MKYSLLIFLFAFLSLSFYQNKNLENTNDSISTNDSCLLKNIIRISSNDSTTVDTSAFIISYDDNRRWKRVDNYFENGGHIYVVYEYDKKGRIKKMTDHYVLKIDSNGYSKGDVANRQQRRFKYKKGANFPKKYKLLLGTAWQKGISDSQLEHMGTSFIEFDEKGHLKKISTNPIKGTKWTNEFSYDFARNTIWNKSISYTKLGKKLQYTIENRYDELIGIQFSLNLVEGGYLQGIGNYRFGNNILYSKMVYGKENSKENYRGKVAYEFEQRNEYNENGFISKSLKNVMDHFDQKKIGNVITSDYEYICE